MLAPTKAKRRKATCKRKQQLPTLFHLQCCGLLRPYCSGVQTDAKTSNIMQQGVQTDATYNIQQCCWELLANNVASVCTGLNTYGISSIKRIKLRANGRNITGCCCIRLHLALIGFKLWTTTCNKVYKRKQHVTFNTLGVVGQR